MSRQRASAHANHAHYCTCGKVVHGNGGKASHEAAHWRRGERAHWTQREHHSDRFGAFPTGNWVRWHTGTFDGSQYDVTRVGEIVGREGATLLVRATTGPTWRVTERDIRHALERAQPQETSS